MSSVSPTINDLVRAMNEHVLDDHNVLSLRYKYGMTRSQRIRDIVKEIVNGKLIFSVVCLSVCLEVAHAEHAVKIKRKQQQLYSPFINSSCMSVGRSVKGSRFRYTNVSSPFRRLYVYLEVAHACVLQKIKKSSGSNSSCNPFINNWPASI